MNSPTQTGSVMMICPNLKCRKVLAVPVQYRGKQVKCQYCGITLTVPQTKTTPSPGEPTEEEAKKGKKEKKKK